MQPPHVIYLIMEKGELFMTNRPTRTWHCYKCNTEYKNTLLYCPICNIARKHSFTLEAKHKRRFCSGCDISLCDNNFSNCIKTKKLVKEIKNAWDKEDKI